MKVKFIAAALCLTASMSIAPASAQAPAAAAKAPADAKKVPACIAQVKKERAAYSRTMHEGVKSGKIDKAEHAALIKTHQELLAMEKKAAEDKKMSHEECMQIHAKIVAEHKQLVAAMHNGPAKAPAKK
jgi:hypothetical protein